MKIQGAAGGSLPIHYACYHGRLDTVKYLLELYPESANVRCGAGRCDGNEKAEIIRFLLSKCPDGAEKVTDDEGRQLPLHVACDASNARDMNLKAVQLLCDAYPEAVFIEDGEEDSPPLDIVKWRVKHYPDRI